MSYEWERAYREERSKLIDGEQDYAKSYDKYVLTLSGGALALSVTFIQNIIGSGPLQRPALIISAWVLFTLCVGATLVELLSKVVDGVVIRRRLSRVFLRR
jgi:hypothetical protein